MIISHLVFHFIIATEDRRPLLTPDVRPVIHEVMQATAHRLGCKVEEFNGVEDHVHFIAEINPDIAIDHFVDDLKAATADALNKHAAPDQPFAWSEGYGAISLTPHDTDDVVAYVRNQAAHHARHDLWPDFERTS